MKHLILFLIVVLGSCINRQSHTVDSSGKILPKEIRIGFSPGQEEVEERLKSLKPFTDYMEKSIGIPVTMIKTSGYSTVIEAMRADKIDVTSLSPFSYVIASEKIDIEPFAIIGSDGLGPKMYTSYLITHKNSGIKNTDDLLKHRKELTISFCDPASTSGHLIPRSFFLSKGIDVEKEFKQVIFTMNHLSLIMTIKSEKIDVAAVSSSLFNKSIRQNKISKEDFVILWESEPIVSSSIVYRKSLPDTLKNLLTKAYLDMRSNDIQAWKAYTSQWTDTNLVLLPSADSIYTPLRKLAFECKILKEHSGAL